MSLDAQASEQSSGYLASGRFSNCADADVTATMG